MNRLTVSNFNEYLKNQGVGFLTSESCGLGMRGLYDLSERGKILIEEFFSVTANNRNWNPQVGADDAVASIRMPYDVIRPLVVYCLFRNGAEVVFDAKSKKGIVYNPEHLLALWSSDGVPLFDDPEFAEIRDIYSKLYNNKYRMWQDFSTGLKGLNTHVFSGRTV